MDGAERRRNISIHALREEGDLTDVLSMTVSIIFLSTPSARRATKELYLTGTSTDISIHALREEGDRPQLAMPLPFLDFYPRPPRGGRLSRFLRAWQCACISIHALREEGDFSNGGTNDEINKFLSTPSARRATGIGQGFRAELI